MTAYSPGADAEPGTYSYDVDGSSDSFFEFAAFSGGLPSTLTITLDSRLGSAPYDIMIDAINDHDGDKGDDITVN